MDRFRRMEIFVAVVEAGQLTRAADTLHLSKSAVSHGLTDLEKYLGMQLLSCNNRSLQLTEAIRITAPDTFGSYLLTPIFSQFMQENPGITLDLNLTERHVDLIEEGFDLAFRIMEEADGQHIARKLSSVRMVTCASPAYLKAANMPLKTHKDLKHHNCLRYTRSPTWRLVKDGKNIDFAPEGTITTNSGENLRQFAVAGQGVIHLPFFLVYHALQKGRLVRVLKNYDGRKMDGYIVRPAHRHCPARVHRLIEFTVERVHSMQAFLSNVDMPI